MSRPQSAESITPDLDQSVRQSTAQRHQRAFKAAPSHPKQSQGDSDIAHGALNFDGPWFNSRTAAAYVPCKSVRAFYKWRDRHGIIPRKNGSVAKADLDRALPKKRGTKAMHPHSLANLKQCRHDESVATETHISERNSSADRTLSNVE